MPYSINKQQRHWAILSALPRADASEAGKSSSELLSKLEPHYCGKLRSQQRAIQRDLQELLQNQQICLDEVRNAIGNEKYYKQALPPKDEQNTRWHYLQELLIEHGMPLETARHVIRQLHNPKSFFDLPATQLLRVSDTIRLTPKHQPDLSIQAEIVKALRTEKVLRASYHKAGAEDEQVRYLSLLGVFQRGSRTYIAAYDYDIETNDISAINPHAKMFVLNRFADVLVCEDMPAKLPPNASLAKQINEEKGWVDFGDESQNVKLKLRVFNYAFDLLSESQLTPTQTFIREERTEQPDHPKAKRSAIVSATVPWTATLVRWLLSLGENVQVLEPPELRHEMARQLQTMKTHYSER